MQRHVREKWAVRVPHPCPNAGNACLLHEADPAMVLSHDSFFCRVAHLNTTLHQFKGWSAAFWLGQKKIANWTVAFFCGVVHVAVVPNSPNPTTRIWVFGDLIFFWVNFLTINMQCHFKKIHSLFPLAKKKLKKTLQFQIVWSEKNWRKIFLFGKWRN